MHRLLSVSGSSRGIEDICTSVANGLHGRQRQAFAATNISQLCAEPEHGEARLVKPETFNTRNPPQGPRLPRSRKTCTGFGMLNPPFPFPFLIFRPSHSFRGFGAFRGSKSSIPSEAIIQIVPLCVAPDDRRVREGAGNSSSAANGSTSGLFAALRLRVRSAFRRPWPSAACNVLESDPLNCTSAPARPGPGWPANSRHTRHTRHRLIEVVSRNSLRL